jgi:hypothetical protein
MPRELYYHLADNLGARERLRKRSYALRTLAVLAVLAAFWFRLKSPRAGALVIVALVLIWVFDIAFSNKRYLLRHTSSLVGMRRLPPDPSFVRAPYDHTGGGSVAVVLVVVGLFYIPLFVAIMLLVWR